MALGRRCEMGCESWPDEPLYARCPVCGEATERWSNLTPLADDEARSILAHAEFEKFYAKRCARLGIPVEGPLPERKSSCLTLVRRPSGGGTQAQSA